MPFLNEVRAPILREEEKKGAWSSAYSLMSASASKVEGDIARTGARYAEKAGLPAAEKFFNVSTELSGLNEARARRQVDPETVEAVSSLSGLAKSPGRAILGHAAQMVPEMAGTLTGGAIGSLGGPLGIAAGLGIAGAGFAGTRMVSEGLQKVRSASNSDLIQNAPGYAKKIASGMSHEKARAWLEDQVVNEPEIALSALGYGAINAIPGGTLEASLLKALMSAPAKQGFKTAASSTLKTMAGEAATEFPQESIEDITGQRQELVTGQRAAYDPAQTVQAGTTGAVVGALTGGIFGAPAAVYEGRGGFKRKPKTPPPAVVIPPDQAAAMAASKQATTPEERKTQTIDTIAQTAATQAPAKAAAAKATAAKAAAKRNAAAGIAPAPAPVTPPVTPAPAQAPLPQQVAPEAVQQPAPLPQQVTPTQEGPVPTPAPAAVAKVTEEEFINNADLTPEEEGEIIPLFKPPEVSPPSAGTQKKQAKARAKKIKPDIPAPQAPVQTEVVVPTEGPVVEVPVVKPPAFVSTEEPKPTPVAKAPSAFVSPEPVVEREAPPAAEEKPTVAPTPKKKKTIIFGPETRGEKPTVIVAGAVQPKGAAETAERRAIPKGTTKTEGVRATDVVRNYETKVTKGKAVDKESAALAAEIVINRDKATTRGEKMKANEALRKLAKKEEAAQKAAKETAKQEKVKARAEGRRQTPVTSMANIADEYSAPPSELRKALPLKMRARSFIGRLKNIVRDLDRDGVPDQTHPFVAGARSLYDQLGVQRERQVTEDDIRGFNAIQEQAINARQKAGKESIIDVEAEREVEPEVEAEPADTDEDVEAADEDFYEPEIEDETEAQTRAREEKRELSTETVTKRTEFTEEARTSELIEAKHGKESSREGAIRGLGDTKTEFVGGTKKKIEVKPGEEIEVTVGGRRTEVVPEGRKFSKEEIAALQAKYAATGKTADNIRLPTGLQDRITEDVVYSDATPNTFNRDVSRFGPSAGIRFTKDDGTVVFVKPEGETTVEGLLGGASYIQPATTYLSAWPGQASGTGTRLQIVQMLQRISNNVRREVPNVKVYMISPDTMGRLRGSSFTNGFYSPNNNAIFIKSDLVGTSVFQPIALHESIHAAYLVYLRKSPEAQADLDLLFNYVKDVHGDKLKGLLTNYSQSDNAEFITEALANPQVMVLLSQIELPKHISEKLGIEAAGKTSALKAFFGLIAKALGVKNTTAFEGILTIQGRFEAHEYSNFPTVEDRAERADRVALRAVGQPLSALHQRAPPTQGPPKQGGTWWHSPVTNVRNMWLRGRAFGQLAQDADKYFGGRASNMLRTVHDAVERRAVITDKYATAGDVVVRKMLAASRAFPAQFEAFEKLLFDATVANLHPDVPLADIKNQHLGKTPKSDILMAAQARARHAELHRQWQALPDGLKQLWHEIDAMTRQRQNDMTLNVVQNLVEVGLERRDDALAQRMFDGTATDADWDLFKTNTIIGSINNALGLKRIQGFYMPLMRDGDWVVRGTYDLSKENLMGGTLIGDDLVQFIDPTPGKRGGKKKARANAKAFAGASDLRAMGFQRLFVDPNDHTKQVPAEQPGGVLAYRVKMQTEHMELHDNASEAEDAKRALEKQGIKTQGVVKRENILGGGKPDMLSSEFNRLADNIAKNRGEGVMSPQLKSALREISVRVLGSTRIQSRRLPRRYVKGYSEDAAHVLSTYNISSAGYLGKLETQPTIDKALQEARAYEKDHSGDASSITIPRSQFLAEATTRVTDLNSRLPRGIDQKVNTILSISQMDKLMSPSYHIINALQNITVTIPYISGRHGVHKTARAFAEAYALVGAGSTAYSGMRDMVRAGRGTSVSLARYLGSGFKREADLPVEVTDHMAELRKRIAKAPNSGNLTKLFDALDFLIRPDASFEVGRLTGKTNALGTAIKHGEFIGRQVGQAVETINRSTAAIAAFNLEMERNGGDVDAAIGYAKDTVNNTHFNYSQSNAPAFMADKHPIMRLALQFKKYAQGMVYLMVKLGHTAISRESDPVVRREAARSLAYVLGTTAAMAGTLGLPIEPFKYGVMALGALGFMDDDWEDVERWVEDNFGTVVAHGLPNMFGVDLSTRMGLNNMLAYGQPGGDDRKSREAWYWQLISGAPGGYAGDLAEALGKIGETTNSALSGNYADAGKSMTEFMEKVVPVRAFADTIAGYRMATEGKVNKRGEVTTEPGVARGILKAIGFQSRVQAEDQRMGRNIRADVEERDAVRQEFFNRWKDATSAAERQSIWAEVKAFNRTMTNKKARVTWKALRNSAKRAGKTLKVKGVYISERNKDLVQGLQ